MEMFLMGLCMSVFGFGIAAAAFGAATRSKSPNSAVQPELPLVKAVAPARFFSDHVAAPPAVPLTVSPRQVPIEVLLLQIENHVRMEQAAAEVFIAFPTQARLHSKTASPFVN
ncbi:MAG TPA: hypothetical protein VKH18_17000 [Terriglobales bacterium]|nr:hypothetical protein [Terriglobales bacterium]